MSLFLGSSRSGSFFCGSSFSDSDFHFQVEEAEGSVLADILPTLVTEILTLTYRRHPQDSPVPDTIL